MVKHFIQVRGWTEKAMCNLLEGTETELRQVLSETALLKTII